MTYTTYLIIGWLQGAVIMAILLHKMGYRKRDIDLEQTLQDTIDLQRQVIERYEQQCNETI